MQAAFSTKLNRFVNSAGETHYANVSAPRFPAVIAPLVTGIVALDDYHPKHTRTLTRTVPSVVLGQGYQNLGPTDFQVIYNLLPLYAQGFSGQGQSLAVLETSDLYNTGDWLAYRRVFGLTKRFPLGTLSTVHPSSAVANCVPPGVETAEREATLDSEVTTAAAPNAAILVASCANTSGDSGLNIALRNLLYSPNPPAVVSISYGNSETVMSPAGKQEVNLLYLQAAAEGISIFVSAGDGGADGYYNDRGTPGTHGISINGLASTEWNVAVGGTDFQDQYFGNTADYWYPTNLPILQSARSYVPEIPWNGSCASELFAAYNGFSHSYGVGGLCNSPTVPPHLLTGLTGGGAPSGCGTGFPSIPGVVSGTCAGYPKPSWQEGLVGIPPDGVRDVPDVSMFASAGAWGHGVAICFSDPNLAGSPCTEYFGISGGTSASAPLMAAIQTLINQGTGQHWGNPNPVYYALARNQFGPNGNAACNASLGNQVSAECAFHDVTQGDIIVTCTPGSPNCYAPSGAIGVLSQSTSSYIPAFPAQTGWDFATGIGSVNGANLLRFWSSAVASLPSLSGQP